ncbi:MAG: RNA polymerase subunit sigma-24 [Verrucomicrobia bacterium]|nr:RNA polymerase subunit sigma-24 [Verrucomicrobiota bacterium]
MVESMFLEHASMLSGFIYALLPNRDVARDVLHEVFVVLRQKADSFEPGSDFGAWARSVARNKALEACHSNSRFPQALPLDVIEKLAGSPEPYDDRWELRRSILKDCINRLTRTARTVVELRYLEGLGIAPLAAKLGWGEPSVRVAVSRAREALRECVAKHEEEATL